VGPAALKAAVEGEMIDADVVHFATHAVNEDESGLRSKLILTKPKGVNGTNDDDGSLPVYEIYDLKLPRTRVVVLSSCQSGAGRNYAGEGTLSLARPFLVLGVPIVIASLWPVDSESTAQIMIDFHEGRTQGHLSSAQALRKAQLEMISGADGRLRHPYYWAPFFSLGGYSNF
jgi:CHAT domain-containing protein